MNKKQESFLLTRRRFLTLVGATAGLAITPKAAFSLLPPVKPWKARRSLTLYNSHTDETFSGIYWRDGSFVPEALKTLNHFMRDHRNGLTASMNPHLYHLLHKIAVECGDAETPFHIICGYRSEKTNQMLRRKSSGVAKNSLHMKGMAIDFCAPSMCLKDLRDVAVAQQAGGVGYYPQSQFIHIDLRPKPTHWG